MSGWQPIETAPEDQLTPILVWEECSRKVYMVTCWPYRGDKDHMVWMPYLTDEGGGYTVDATHWMPLPEGPCPTPAT